MKIIRVKSFAPQFEVDFHPDSALLLQGRPLFMPEEGRGWQLEVHPAVRIGRLGKNISEKFAPRYYDGFTLALRLTLPSEPLMESVIAGMDSGLIHGMWLDPAKAQEPLAWTAGETGGELSPQAHMISSAINLISRYTTLKIGDIILLPPVGEALALEAPSHVNLSLGGVDVLRQKVV